MTRLWAFRFGVVRGLLGMPLLCWTLGVPLEGWAATAQLAWDRPPVDASVSLEYRVWWGRKSRGNVTSPEEWRYPKVRVTRNIRFTVKELPGQKQTCFAVTARNRQTGEESDYSNELCRIF